MKIKEKNTVLRASIDDGVAVLHSNHNVGFDQINGIKNSEFSNHKVSSFRINSSGNLGKKKILKENKDKITLVAEDRKKDNKVEKEIETLPTDSNKIQTFYTVDKRLLFEYYKLRCEAYKKEWEFSNFEDFEREADKQGNIIISIKNNKVIGGACVMFSDECEYLSNEIPDTRYSYKSVLKDSDPRENLKYVEVSGVVVAEGYRDRTVTNEIFNFIIREAKSRKCNYIVGLSFLVIAREYRIIFKNLGYKLDIGLNYPWKLMEVYNYLRMFPMYVKIS